MWVCVRVCVRACVRVCVCARARERERETNKRSQLLSNRNMTIVCASQKLYSKYFIW